jgi:hypothetical protein
MSAVRFIVLQVKNNFGQLYKHFLINKYPN